MYSSVTCPASARRCGMLWPPGTGPGTRRSSARRALGAPGDQVSGIDDEGSAMRVVAAAKGRCPVAGYLIAGLRQVEIAIYDVARDQEIPHLGPRPLRAGQRRGCPGDRERTVRRDAGRVGCGGADAQSSREQSGRRDPGQSRPSSQLRCPFRRGRRPPGFRASAFTCTVTPGTRVAKT
jgi:hypothetical protein